MAIPLNVVLQAQRRQALRLNQQITDDELAKVFADGARDASQMAREIAAAPTGVGASTREAQLRMAAQRSHDLSDKLWHATEDITRQSIFRSVDMATRQSLDVDRVVGMPLSFIRGYEDALLGSAQATAEAIIARRQFGYTLSERVYRNNLQTVGRLHRTIESGLVNNLSARELARSVRGLIDPTVPGGPSFAAMRLARTEINNSYHFAQQEHYKSRPWINKVAWHLSGSHPKPDICDEIADAGPYNPEELPDKPHPQCLCYTTPELPGEEEFLDALFEGEYNDWLMENGNERIVCHSSCQVTGDDGVDYQRWDTLEEMEDYLEENWNRLEEMGDLTDEALDVLDTYVADPSYFNRPLRGTQPKEWSEDVVNFRLQEADRLANLIDASLLDEDLILYRGLSPKATENVLQGKRFTDPGFMSTSLNEEIAREFTSLSASELPSDPFAGLGTSSGTSRFDETGYIMEIQAPNRTRGIGLPEGAIAAGEQEVILQRNTTVEIMTVDHIGKKILARVVR